jgi:hypothetical protein
MATHDNSAFAQRLTDLDWMQADLKNFKKLILETEFLIWLRNSVLISITVSMVGVSLSSMAGYAIARYRFPGHNWILRSLLTTQMFPASMLMLPMFVVLTQLKLINSFVGLLVVYSSSALPFCIWQIKGFFETVPKELEEAGAKVLYSFPILKVHSKMICVERKEGEKLRRYCYLSTGNFNENTSKLYVDSSLLTKEKYLGREVSAVFDILADTRIKREFKHLLVAPDHMRHDLYTMIDQEIKNSLKGKPAFITLKLK